LDISWRFIWPCLLIHKHGSARVIGNRITGNEMDESEPVWTDTAPGHIALARKAGVSRPHDDCSRKQVSRNRFKERSVLLELRVVL
jgi:hypothetical protein